LDDYRRERIKQALLFGCRGYLRARTQEERDLIRKETLQAAEAKLRAQGIPVSFSALNSTFFALSINLSGRRGTRGQVINPVQETPTVPDPPRTNGVISNSSNSASPKVYPKGSLVSLIPRKDPFEEIDKMLQEWDKRHEKERNDRLEKMQKQTRELQIETQKLRAEREFQEEKKRSEDLRLPAKPKVVQPTVKKSQKSNGIDADFLIRWWLAGKYLKLQEESRSSLSIENAFRLLEKLCLSKSPESRSSKDPAKTPSVYYLVENPSRDANR
jgi:hypothetical protein